MINTTNSIERLEELAAWHRINADHAGCAWIWEARLRTAEDLERRAAELRVSRARNPTRSASEPSGVISTQLFGKV